MSGWGRASKAASEATATAYAVFAAVSVLAVTAVCIVGVTPVQALPSYARQTGQQCAACHGAKGEGGVGDRLVGGQGTLAAPKPVKTVGSYWPYAPTLFDYIRRAMPQNAPESLSNDDVYAVSAYILNMNGLLPADATLDAKMLSAIKMPNRGMFVGDPRPDVKNPDCMTGCGNK